MNVSYLISNSKLVQSIKFPITGTSVSSLPPPDDDIPGSRDKDSSGASHMDDVTLSSPQDKDSSGADASHVDDDKNKHNMWLTTKYIAR